MRTIFRNAVLAAGAILFCAVGTAQASESIVLKANVPFQFVVRGQVFPAGKYANPVVADEDRIYITGQSHQYALAPRKHKRAGQR